MCLVLGFVGVLHMYCLVGCLLGILVFGCNYYCFVVGVLERLVLRSSDCCLLGCNGYLLVGVLEILVLDLFLYIAFVQILILQHFVVRIFDVSLNCFHHMHCILLLILFQLFFQLFLGLFGYPG